MLPQVPGKGLGLAAKRIADAASQPGKRLGNKMQMLKKKVGMFKKPVSPKKPGLPKNQEILDRLKKPVAPDTRPRIMPWKPVSPKERALGEQTRKMPMKKAQVM